MISSFYIKNVSIVSIFFLNISCGSNEELNKKIVTTQDTTISKDSIVSHHILTEVKDTTSPKAVNLETAKNIEILSINKEMGKDSADAGFYEKCKSWSLTIIQLKKIIRKFKSISSEAQNLSYSYMPCRIKGEIKIDNIEFKYWLNAGSTLTLKNNNIELYFACSSKECKNFFLTGEDLKENIK